MDGYPRTPHFSFSPGINPDDTATGDDIWHQQQDPSLLTDVVVTEKLDGGNCCIRLLAESGTPAVYARTHGKEATHPSFGPVKTLAAQSQWNLDPDMMYFGECMFGIHSIEYKNLSSFFYLFAVFDVRRQAWLAWDEVVQTAQHVLECPHVPVVYRGALPGTPKQLQRMLEEWMKGPSSVGGSAREGFVVRVAAEFPPPASDFGRYIAKYVRKGHVQTDDTWLRTWQRASLGA
eukprot:PhM_4_TR7524/c0_g1_i1/m.81097